MAFFTMALLTMAFFEYILYLFRYVVVGIVSTGKGCGDVTPGVYARVTKYKDWIRENIKDGDCSKN